MKYKHKDIKVKCWEKSHDLHMDPCFIYSTLTSRLLQENFYTLAWTTLTLDDDTRPDDALPIAKLPMAWESCKKRSEVETEAAAHRAVKHLPPQLAVEDIQTAREAYEKKENKVLEGHKVPSES